MFRYISIHKGNIHKGNIMGICHNLAIHPDLIKDGVLFNLKDVYTNDPFEWAFGWLKYYSTKH